MLDLMNLTVPCPDSRLPPQKANNILTGHHHDVKVMLTILGWTKPTLVFHGVICFELP